MNRHRPTVFLCAALLCSGPAAWAQVPALPGAGASAGQVPSQLSNLTRPSGAGTFNKTFNMGVNQRFSKTSPLQDSRFGMKNYERTFSQLMDKRADTWRKLYESGNASPWTTTGNTYATGELRTPESNGWTGQMTGLKNSEVRKERTSAVRFDEAPIFNLMDKKNFAGPATEALDRTSFNSIRRREYNVDPVEKKAGLEVFGGKGGLNGPVSGAPSGNGFFDEAPAKGAAPAVIQPGSQPVPSVSGERAAPPPASTTR